MTTEIAVDTALEAKIAEIVDQRFQELQDHIDELLTQRIQQQVPKDGPRRLAIVASKGTLDMAYPPLILATTAAAMGWEVGIFFTFYGLDILNRKKLAHLKVPPLANPAMPVPVPNFVGAIPGMTAMATSMMKGWMRRAQMPTLQELLAVAQETDVHLFACTTTMGVMGVKAEDILPGAQFVGAATFLDFASEAQVSLFI